MSAIRCPNPGCGGTEGFAVRECYEWHRGFEWWAPWRGVHLIRVRIGDCVVCCRCDTAVVHTDAESFLTQRSLKALGVTPLRPIGSPESKSRVDDENRREMIRPREIVP